MLDSLASRALFRQVLRPVLVFVILVIGGVGGFYILGNIGIINALFWLLDPTSIELHFQTHDGPATLVKGYAIAVFSGMILSSLWIGETFVSAAFSGQMQEELQQVRMEQNIDEVENHVIVCGYGTFGKTIASRLQEKGRDIVVVENQESQFQQAVDEGVLAVHGDARREEILTDAGVERASTVVGAIDDSKLNIQIGITASQIEPTLDLIVRAGDQMDETLAKQAGVDEVVVPEIVSGEQVCTSL
jgi:voltage-gated potassium channel